MSLGLLPHPPNRVYPPPRRWVPPLSRRGLLGGASAAALLAAGARGLARPAAAAGTGPKPVPGGINPFGTGLFHVYDFGGEPATITDFRGTVGIARVAGSGTVTKGTAGVASATPVATGGKLVFDVDMRFMQGTYVGEDGKEHDGTFGFI
jgi:hypothetical protein